MEKRAILTILICTIIFFVWIDVVVPWIWPPQAPPPKETPAEETKPDGTGETPKVEPKVEPETDSTPPQNPDETFEFDTDLYHVVFTNRGGGIRDLAVRFPNKDALVPLLAPIEPDRPHFALRVPGLPSNEDLAAVNWERVKDSKPLTVEYRYPMSNRVEVTKRFVFDKDRHTLEMNLYFENRSGQIQRFAFEILPYSGILRDSNYRDQDYCNAFAGLRTGDNWSVDTKPAAKINKEEWQVDDPKKDWAGIKNRYFAAVFIPEAESELKAVHLFRYRTLTPEGFKVAEGFQNIDLFVTCREVEIGAGQILPLRYTAYVGPIRADALAKVPRGLAELLDYSWFNFVGTTIVAILNFFFGIFRNYGLAILFTTLLIRLCLFPLSKKSQVSMFRIQQLQPKVQILRERYKDDQRKMGVEQMRLFRENKVSPMSGCLPMILQLPIFVGMYSVLDMSIDLRNSPFVLWIHDLSQPDTLAGPWKPVEIFFLTIASLNLLPIIMTITWFLQAYFAPRSPDPQMAMQQKMMMFMPIVFGLMCYSLASGLSFYFFVNSLLAMAEQKLIKKIWLEKEERKAKEART